MKTPEDVSTVRVPPVLSGRTGPALPGRVLHRNVEEAIWLFGSDVLTAREQTVVQLILRGFSSKLVASELKIALKTEKVHRRNVYAKLGVNSHAALFGKFLCFLSSSLESRPIAALPDARQVAAAMMPRKACHHFAADGAA